MDRTGHYLEAERLLALADNAIDEWVKLPQDAHVGKLNFEVIARLNTIRAEVHARLASATERTSANAAIRSADIKANERVSVL
jgi:hypothetical protein